MAAGSGYDREPGDPVGEGVIRHQLAVGGDVRNAAPCQPVCRAAVIMRCHTHWAEAAWEDWRGSHRWCTPAFAGDRCQRQARQHGETTSDCRPPACGYERDHLQHVFSMLDPEPLCHEGLARDSVPENYSRRLDSRGRDYRRQARIIAGLRPGR